MDSKKRRHAKILEIIENQTIEKQEEIVEKLQSEGFNVTQATVSRDIHNLRLVKVMLPSGVQAYKRAESAGGNSFSEKLREIFSHSVTSVVPAGNIVVIKTLSGAAQAAASAVDSMSIKEIVGSIAGDDTIMIVALSGEDAKYICSRLNEMRG
ncbi:MAG: Arginine repressor [Firmicutes bacterium ADurb.Bin193]|nr:MAG: Arginine repressor [Firmicutes bacterium ADurb.Bin193]